MRRKRECQDGEKVKRYLSIHGNRPLILTSNKVRYWWNILNRSIFNGELDPYHSVQIHERLQDNAYGWCMYDPNDNTVVLKLRLEYNHQRIFFSVLAHEMVHHWEYQHYGRAGHGQRFNQWKEPIITKTGITISEWITE